MAHFAEIDSNNVVLRVLVVSNDEEHRGQEFLADDMGLGGTWVKCSYNTRHGVHYGEDGQPDGGTALRINYPGEGMTYDPTLDAFLYPQPFPSWVLDESIGSWKSPTGEMFKPGHVWDEDSQAWVPKDQPYPSWVWNETDDQWEPPIPVPDDFSEEKIYDWDEGTQSWVAP